jgi:16S rRNA processing protein RimM
MRVVSDQGDDIGEIVRILETGANDVYIIQPESGDEVLIPAIESVILAIDFDKREMLVHLLEGLIPEKKIRKNANT